MQTIWSIHSYVQQHTFGFWALFLFVISTFSGGARSQQTVWFSLNNISINSTKHPSPRLCSLRHGLSTLWFIVVLYSIMLALWCWCCGLTCGRFIIFSDGGYLIHTDGAKWTGRLPANAATYCSCEYVVVWSWTVAINSVTSPPLVSGCVCMGMIWHDGMFACTA